jgi:hypothetical protein
MRKFSKTQSSDLDRYPADSDLRDARPLRIPGATITSWSESLEIDLDVFFARRAHDATVAGTASSAPMESADKERTAGDRSADGQPPDRPKEATVSLSDGTSITFATAV